MLTIKSRADLEGLRGTPAFTEALQALAGAVVMKTNIATYPQTHGTDAYDGPEIAPIWHYEADEDALSRIGMTRSELDAELASAGLDPVAIPPDEGAPLTQTELGNIDKAVLSRYAGRRRWQKEVGGTVWNGWPVHTDRESQSKIVAERLAISEAARTDPDGWKFADGIFRMLSNAEFITLSDAVRTHVRTCFTSESDVLAGIADGTITAFAEIDDAFA